MRTLLFILICIIGAPAFAQNDSLQTHRKPNVLNAKRMFQVSSAPTEPTGEKHNLFPYKYLYVDSMNNYYLMQEHDIKSNKKLFTTNSDTLQLFYGKQWVDYDSVSVGLIPGNKAMVKMSIFKDKIMVSKPQNSSSYQLKEIHCCTNHPQRHCPDTDQEWDEAFKRGCVF